MDESIEIDATTSSFDQMVTLTKQIQDRLCAAIETIDGAAAFTETTWERPGGGGGRTRVLQGGDVFEKAGVNTSAVYGSLPDSLASELVGTGTDFRATGISIVIHPRSPLVPTSHANFRRIERGDTGWYGGGADLTPYYLDGTDAAAFHRLWYDVCERHAAVADYRKWKTACDEYFYLPHRGEHRGVGGIFFDYLTADDTRTEEDLWDFVVDAAQAFETAYLPIVDRHRRDPYDADQRDHQLIRRGRYVEFNLVYDRGTRFGLETGGNVESILMSLPDPVRWVYDYRPAPGTPEAELVDALRSPRDWV